MWVVKVDGAVYGFYARENILDPADGSVVYEKDEEIGQYTIVNGTTTAEVDYLGKYYWKEIKPSEGCKVAGNLDVDLLYDNQNVPVIIKDMISYEPLKKQAFRIQKLEDPNIHDESIVLKDAEDQTQPCDMNYLELENFGNPSEYPDSFQVFDHRTMYHYSLLYH